MREIKYYRVCQVKCKCCGDVLKHVNHTKEPQSHRMMTCSCGKVQLDPHICAYRINGFPDDYEDLSEEWPEKLDYYIWKAKHQHGLTDEQVNYFLKDCTDWTLLLEYAQHCRAFGKEHALKILYEEYSDNILSIGK